MDPIKDIPDYNGIGIYAIAEKYDEIKAAAEKQGQSLNGYIVTAIDEKIKRDSE